jgi:hypothetical protein
MSAPQLAEIILRLSADLKNVTDNVGTIQSTLKRRTAVPTTTSTSASPATAPPSSATMSYREAHYQ